MRNESKYDSSRLSYDSPMEGEPSPSAMLSHASDVTVFIEAYRDGKLCDCGAGVMITEDGLILTSIAVLFRMDAAKAVVCKDGERHRYDCEILYARNWDWPFALLKIEGSGFTAASLLPACEPIRTDTPVWVAGFPEADGCSPLALLMEEQPAERKPEDLKLSLLTGKIVEEIDDETETASVDLSGNSGSMGSPVFSAADGRVIGIYEREIMAMFYGKVYESCFLRPIRQFLNHFPAVLSEEESE